MSGQLLTAFAPKRARVSLVPLIDVVFILLLFFLLSTQLDLLHNLDIEFPVQVDASDPPDVHKLVLMNDSGEFTFGGTRYANVEPSFLRSLLTNDEQIIYVIESDDSVHVQGLIWFVDRLHEAGITNVSIYEDP